MGTQAHAGATGIARGGVDLHAEGGQLSGRPSGQTTLGLRGVGHRLGRVQDRFRLCYQGGCAEAKKLPAIHRRGRFRLRADASHPSPFARLQRLPVHGWQATTGKQRVQAEKALRQSIVAVSLALSAVGRAGQQRLNPAGVMGYQRGNADGVQAADPAFAGVNRGLGAGVGGYLLLAVLTQHRQAAVVDRPLGTSGHAQMAAVATLGIQGKVFIVQRPGVPRAGVDAGRALCRLDQGVHAALSVDLGDTFHLLQGLSQPIAQGTHCGGFRFQVWTQSEGLTMRARTRERICSSVGRPARRVSCAFRFLRRWGGAFPKSRPAGLATLPHRRP